MAGDSEPYQSITEELEEADRKEAEYLEHVKTPEVDRSSAKKAEEGEEEPGPSMSLAGYREIFQRRGLEEITAAILAKDQGVSPPAAKVQLDRAVKAYGLIRRRVGFDDYYRLPEEVIS